VLRKFALALGAAILALVLTYPVVCAGGEFELLNRCENLLGLHLPGFSYAGGEEYRIYVFPLACAGVAFGAVWWLVGRSRALTSRS
jgi:hypothetical protein